MFKSKEQKFWKWFSKVENKAYENFEDEEQRDLFFGKLSKEIKTVNDNLVFEFGRKPGNETIEFAISADGIKAAFPSVIKLCKAAPSLAPRWNIVAFRQRDENAEGFILRFNDRQLGFKDIYLLYAVDKEDSEELLHLQFHVRDYQKGIEGSVFLLLDNLLGEYDAIMSISSVDWVVLDENNIENLSPFVALRELVDERNARKNTLN